MTFQVPQLHSELIMVWTRTYFLQRGGKGSIVGVEFICLLAYLGALAQENDLHMNGLLRNLSAIMIGMYWKASSMFNLQESCFD